jgi:hypothetical protein
MPITMRCPGCQTRFDFADDLEGKRIKCKSCGDIFRVAGPAKTARKDDEEDDRSSNRNRRREDDYDRQPARSRRVLDDDDDDRPRARRRDDDSDDERPRRKGLNPLLIILPIGLVALLIIVPLVIYLAIGGKKGGGSGAAADALVAPSRTCPLEVAEKEAGILVVPDSGTTFGLLRNTGQFPNKSWYFEPYDLTSQKRTGSIVLKGVEDPKAWSLSPDGKNLLLTEARGLGWAGDQWLWLFPLAGQRKQEDKWFPYQKNDKRPFDSPALWRAYVVANDKVLTLATDRTFFVYSLPTYENQTYAVAAVDKEGLGKRSNPPHDYQYRTQWEFAFTADRQRMAVWTGDGYTVVHTADGAEAGGAAGVRSLARAEWGNTAGDSNRVKGGPAAFSPDGNTLAAIVAPDFGNKRLLCLWNVADGQLTSLIRIADNQWREAAGIAWWGNKFIATFGGQVDGLLIDVQKGLPRRQLMAPMGGRYGFGRDGKLWWIAGEDRNKPATLHVVDALDPSLLGNGDDYEQIPDLGNDRFLRRLWLEPGGVLKQPTRDDPPIKQRLIRQ